MMVDRASVDRVDQATLNVDAIKTDLSKMD
jgi:hypothetical protein